MPARNLQPVPPADPWQYLAETVLAMPAERLEAWLAHLSPADASLVEEALGRAAQQGWLAHPAAMAHHLTGGEVRLWGYVRLLSEAVADSPNRPRQQWNLPSQYGKTTLLAWSVVWLLRMDPTRRLMYVTYNQERADDFGRAVLRLVRQHGATLGLELARDRQATSEFQTAQGGRLVSVGINGAITGRPMDVILLDDLLKGWVEAHSEHQREVVWERYSTQVRLRLQNDGVLISVGTRWHEDDWFGRARRQADDPDADQWWTLRLPAIAEHPDPEAEDPALREPDPLGREPGQVLEPERFGEREVQARAAGLGPYLAAGLEQQRPAPQEGGEFKRDWWAWRDSPPEHADEWITSWDTKLKDKAAGSWVVGQVWCRIGNQYVCCDQLRGQWGQAQAKLAMALLAVRWPQATRHYVENKGYGPEVIAELRRSDPGYELDAEFAAEVGVTAAERDQVQATIRRGLVGLLPEEPKGDKLARARAHAGLVQSGHVELVERPWATHLVNEAASFPDEPNDCVDALSQALKLLRLGGQAQVASHRSRAWTPAGPVRRR